MNRRLSRDEAWRLTGALLLIAALVLRSGPLALLGAGLLVASLSVSLWGRYALRGVTYRRYLGEQRAAFGEELPFSVEIDNRKPLPLPWLEADDSLPAGLERFFLPQGESHASNQGPGAPEFRRTDAVERPLHPERGTGRALLRQVLSLGWFERVRLRYRLRCGARGAFTLGPVRLASGDPFGFTAREVHLGTLDRLLVYPKVLPLSALGLPSRHPFGDRPDRRRLFVDPARLAGVRPYVAGDSPRHIHWKASARQQSLQTRVYEPTTSHTLMLYLNLASFEGYWWAALNRDLLELSIVAAASVASWGLEQGFHVGLATNGSPAGGGAEIGIAPAGGAQHRVRLLEALARVSQFARTPLEGMLRRDRTRLPWGTTVVVVTAVLSPTILEALDGLRGGGHAPAVLHVGGQPPPALPGLPVFHIPDSVPWTDLPSIAPAPAPIG